MPETCYRCEICKATWNMKEFAVRCEKSHPKIKEVKANSYRVIQKYPDFIKVTFEDGEERLYRLS